MYPYLHYVISKLRFYKVVQLHKPC